MKNPCLKLLVLFLICPQMPSLAAFQAPSSLYGFTLGSKIKLPQCAKNKRTGLYEYGRPTKGPCFQDEGTIGLAEPRYTSYKILFPEHEDPKLAKDGSITVLIYKNIIHKVIFFTYGKDNFKEIGGALREKFGPPLSESKVEGTLTIRGYTKSKKSSTFS